MPANVRSEFDRIVKGKGADAFAPVEDRGCGSCRTEIIAQQYNELLDGGVRGVQVVRADYSTCRSGLRRATMSPIALRFWKTEADG